MLLFGWQRLRRQHLQHLQTHQDLISEATKRQSQREELELSVITSPLSVRSAEVEAALSVLPSGVKRESIISARKSVFDQMESDESSETPTRFGVDVFQLHFGRMSEAALGIESFVCVPPTELRVWQNEGLNALRREFEEHGTPDDILCMRYVLDEEAGSNDRIWPNGDLKFDHAADGSLAAGRMVDDGSGRQRRMRLADFVAHPKAQLAQLEEAEVAALRIYTTAAYQSINTPLRDQGRRERGERHPLALTAVLIKNGAIKLRAVDARGEDATRSIALYRGMRNVTVPKEFLATGGTELAPM